MIVLASTIEEELEAMREHTLERAKAAHLSDTFNGGQPWRYVSPKAGYGMDWSVECLVTYKRHGCGEFVYIASWRLNGLRIGYTALRGILEGTAWPLTLKKYRR